VIRVFAFLALLLFAAPAAASAATKRPFPDWSGYTPPSRPFAGPVKDRVLAGSAGAPQASTAASTYSRYRVQGGPSVLVAVSPSYGSATTARVQAYIDSVFPWLADPSSHGSEVSDLLILIDTPGEMQRDCGASDALACYSPRAGRMIVTGEDTPDDQAPLPFVAAHEYGHHVANNRASTFKRNSAYPFGSGDVGPPRWTSLERVCPLTYQGRLFPGDEGSHYEENPGENWAEAYAMRLYPSYIDAWAYTPLLRPGSGAYGAIRRDVDAPWRGAARKTLAWRVGPGRARTRSFKLSTPLDGYARIKVSGASSAKFTVRRYRSKRFVASTRARYTATFLCGNRSAEFKVTRRSGAGLVKVTLSRP
jgi:hypothetical protein